MEDGQNKRGYAVNQDYGLWANWAVGSALGNLPPGTPYVLERRVHLADARPI